MQRSIEKLRRVLPLALVAAFVTVVGCKSDHGDDAEGMDQPGTQMNGQADDRTTPVDEAAQDMVN